MKILEIRDNKGYFRFSEEAEWQPIDMIGKEQLLKLLDTFLDFDIEMDSLDDHELQNQAQLIIYRSIYDKLQILVGDKKKFRDESDRKYLKEMKKYSLEEEDKEDESFEDLEA